MMVLKKAERILNGIESMTMRTMVEMLYVDKLPGSTVRQELGLTEWQYKQARKSIEDAESMALVKWHSGWEKSKSEENFPKPIDSTP